MLVGKKKVDFWSFPSQKETYTDHSFDPGNHFHFDSYETQNAAWNKRNDQ